MTFLVTCDRTIIFVVLLIKWFLEIKVWLTSEPVNAATDAACTQ